MRVHVATLSAGISRTKEFEKKDLAKFAINVGTKCGHSCLYCSTGAMLTMHSSFRDVGENPFESGYAIVDPETPERVARDAVAMRSHGLVQLCTAVDAWSPEAQQYDLGRRCLEAGPPRMDGAHTDEERRHKQRNQGQGERACVTTLQKCRAEIAFRVTLWFTVRSFGLGLSDLVPSSD